MGQETNLDTYLVRPIRKGFHWPLYEFCTLAKSAEEAAKRVLIDVYPDARNMPYFVDVRKKETKSTQGFSVNETITFNVEVSLNSLMPWGAIS